MLRRGRKYFKCFFLKCLEWWYKLSPGFLDKEVDAESSQIRTINRRSLGHAAPLEIAKSRPKKAAVQAKFRICHPPKKSLLQNHSLHSDIKRVPMKAEHGYLYGWGHHLMWQNSHVRKNHLVLRIVGSVTSRYPCP